jgi:hypothetical protein
VVHWLDRLIRHRAGEQDIYGTRSARRAGTQTCNEAAGIWLRAAHGRPGGGYPATQPRRLP